MLMHNPRTNKLSRAQGTLVDDREIRSVVKFMKDVAGPSFERQLLQLRRPSEDGTGLSQVSDEDRLLQSKNNSSASLKAAQEDPLFERAVEIVLESRRGSVSLLQRRLAIGYTRSSRLIDLMGIAGIISGKFKVGEGGVSVSATAGFRINTTRAAVSCKPSSVC